MPGTIREHKDTLFAHRAKYQEKIKHYEKQTGERFVCMKNKTPKSTITNP